MTLRGRPCSRLLRQAQGLPRAFVAMTCVSIGAAAVFAIFLYLEIKTIVNLLIIGPQRNRPPSILCVFLGGVVWRDPAQQRLLTCIMREMKLGSKLAGRIMQERRR